MNTQFQLFSLRLYLFKTASKGIANDVTNLGRWGNGDVELRISSLDELPYVMGLVRQAFESQMGDGGTQD